MVDNSPDKTGNNNHQLEPEDKMVFDKAKKQWTSDLARAHEAPARKAAIKIDYPALQLVARKTE